MSALVVESIGPLATLQDHGRFGHAHLGVPASGAWDLEARACALAAVGGAFDDAVVELPLLGAAFRCVGEVQASIDGEPMRSFSDGDRLEIPRHERAIRVLAVRGGFEVPRVLGSRSTLVVARFGGFEGRMLRRGDVLPIGEGLASPQIRNVADRSATLPIPATLDAIATHDAPAPLLARLADIDLIVSTRSDRVGTRFEGEAIEGRPAAIGGVRPLVPGAVELPPDGHPIVVGPDGPTTGGYATLAVLTRASRSALARVRPGRSIRLRITSGEDFARGILRR